MCAERLAAKSRESRFDEGERPLYRGRAEPRGNAGFDLEREIDVNYRRSGRQLGTARDARRAFGLDNDLLRLSAQAHPDVLSLMRGALS